MALPVIKATKFNYGAYAQPKQVKFKDPNAGVVAGIASVGRQVVQKVEENKLQEQKNNITIAKNNSEFKYAATQLQNQFGDKTDKYIQSLVDRFADNEQFRVSNPDNLEQYLDTKNQLNGLLQQLLAVKQKGISLKKNFKDMDVNNLTGSSLDNYHRANALIDEHFELSDKDGELFISLTTTDLSKVKAGAGLVPDFSNVFTKQEAVSNYMLDENYFKVDTKWNTTDSNFTQALTKIVAAAKNQKIQLEKRQDANLDDHDAFFLNEKGVRDYLNSDDSAINENLDIIIQQSGKKIYEDEIAGVVGSYDPNNADQNAEIKNYLINKLVEQGSFKDGVFVNNRKRPKVEKQPEYIDKVTRITNLFDKNRIISGNKIIYNSMANLEDIKNNPTAYNIPEASRPLLANFMSKVDFAATHVANANSEITRLEAITKPEDIVAEFGSQANYDLYLKGYKDIVKFYDENKDKPNLIINTNIMTDKGESPIAMPQVVENFESAILQQVIRKDALDINDVFITATDTGIPYARYKPGMSFEDYKEATYKRIDKANLDLEGEIVMDESLDKLIQQQYNSLKK
tara:strand:- start:2995 stop:4710 length:1716 start_codon:yes stop_codon:yes gene_type:complete